ncbi:MAG: hypothetical protein M3077_05115 [Candidatus Dormibacteraeota bacterium]|nr:hypothetical protein [Candidatus Dormibacteraeota bacterium]
MMLLSTLVLAACGSESAATPTTSAPITPTATVIGTATSTPVAVARAQFVSTPPSSGKVAAAQTDPWIDVVAFHEIGLRPGQVIAYEVTGTATASYTCNGKAQTAAGPVGAARTFTANASGEVSEVIAVQPPASHIPGCAASYPSGIWSLRYGTLHLVDHVNQVSEDVPGMSGGA